LLSPEEVRPIMLQSSRSPRGRPRRNLQRSLNLERAIILAPTVFAGICNACLTQRRPSPLQSQTCSQNQPHSINIQESWLSNTVSWCYRMTGRCSCGIHIARSRRSWNQPGRAASMKVNAVHSSPIFSTTSARMNPPATRPLFVQCNPLTLHQPCSHESASLGQLQETCMTLHRIRLLLGQHYTVRSSPFTKQ
jgi:hypothetical protein